MNIIQIFPYYPPHMGGAEQRIRTLSERLAKKGHKVEVFTSDIGCPKDKQLRSTKNLKIHYLPGKKFGNLVIMSSLYKELKKVPQDSIMHMHVVHMFTPEIIRLVSKIRKIPYIIHIRGDLSSSKIFIRKVLECYKEVFLKRTLKDSHKLIVLTEDYKKMILNRYKLNLDNIYTIPNATDFKIIDKKEIHLSFELNNLLFVGRLTEEKNVDSIIHALYLLKNKSINFKIVGEGEYKKKLINLIKELNLNKRVIFLGELNRKNLYKEYLKSDLVILPSKYECFSSVLLEAMATGVPIIASDIPGTRNVIKNGHNGLLVKPTPEKIAEAIDKLIKNPKLREKLARNGLKEVKKYSWDKIVEQTERVYEEVLREHSKKLNQKRSE
jgi:glycosyltransferase involved in cell wall biosynthesis